jgi:ERF superfamily protein
LIVHSSSESIGTIAAALAKAQAELTNPEKSLVATIRSHFPREGDRTFRYAPLSSGLDIVRKSLGRHEIATIQTTTIDKDAGLLRLTTVLAHSSGEWISSEWPVCQLTDVASAQRMGAALTYARRYALFTLVGIAGEDDLDAPDLGTVAKAEIELQQVDYQTRSDGNGGLASRAPRGGSNSAASARPVLAPGESVTVRERLVAELSAINTADEAAVWAQRNLPVKDTLTAGDAKILEERFQARLSAISEGHVPDGTTSADTLDGLATHQPPRVVPDKNFVSAGQADADTSHKTSPVPKKRPRSGVIRALGKTVRLRDKDHRRFVLRQPCLVCGRVPSDPHHLTFTQPRGLGYRVSDEFTVPVCRIHHRELHRSGDEAAWWQRLNIDPIPVALRLWQHTHADGELAQMSEGTTTTQAAKTLDVSTTIGLDPHANADRPMSQDDKHNASE